MTYYENDIHPDVDNDLNPVPGGIDDNTAQHVVTYSVAFGVEGSVNSMPPRNDDPFAWPAPTNASGKIDDLRHAAFNGRGGYFSAQSPQQLITGIDGALRSIQARIGSAASVAFNTGSLSTNSELYISLFNSQRWNGDLLSYDLDPSSGAISNSANWSAGTRLDARALGMSPRTLLTYDGTDGIALQWDELTTEQKNDFRTDPDGDRDTAASGMARLDFFRGARSCELSAAGTCSYSDGINTFDTKSFRERSSRLGDIVHSGPVFVGAPESNWPDVPPFPSSAGETYTEFRNDSASRPGVIYVGSNDGMLHGFAKSTGAELLGYVPNVLFSDNSAEGLHYLSDPAFTHRYTVDLTPSIADAYIRTQTGGTTSWKTVLVGGLRGGGRGVYALDVTDPAQFSESGAYPAKTVMWEFSSDDDSDLGYTFSRPSIVPLEDSGNTIRWAVVMGNGYNDLGSGEAKLFILFIEEGLDGTWSGSDYVEISTEVGDSSDRNGLATPAVVDTDGDGLADRVYAGDLFGNMWAFDLSGSNDGNWDVAFKDGGNPQPLFAAEDGQQITTAPVIVRNDVIPTSNSNSPNTLVIFGTGQYLTADDIETDDQQSIYGIWDAGTGGLDKGDLVEQKIDTGSTSEGVPGRTLTDKAIDFEDDYGWYMKLPDPGERQVTDAVIRGDLVYFNTMIPDTDPCSFGGSGWLMVAKWLNGGRVDQVAFDLNNDALMNDADEIDGEPAAGMALQGIATSPVMLSGKRYTSTTETTGGGTVEMTDIIESGGPRTGRLSWEELTP